MKIKLACSVFLMFFLLTSFVLTPSSVQANSNQDNQNVFIEIDKDDYHSSDDFFVTSSSSGCDSRWYYDTGTTLPQDADYTSCDLLNRVRVGDILYEEATIVSTLTGHVAIVEGIFFDNGQPYIRLIEAVSCGVVRSVLDCNRLSENDGEVYRVIGASYTERSNAVDFAINELEKGFNHVFSGACTSRNTWYCSQLVHCAYDDQGYNLAGTPIFFPRQITNSDLTTIATVGGGGYLPPGGGDGPPAIVPNFYKEEDLAAE
jgi:uncharacterized protein YycO